MSTNNNPTADRWGRYVYVLDTAQEKHVEQIDFDFLMDRTSGILNVTDLQLQGGKNVSGTHPHLSEFFKPVYFNIDEHMILETVSNPIKIGIQPQLHKQVLNRFYNISYRGHSYISVPNVFHENYLFPLVTTYLDLTLTPKNDFDLLRVTTMNGHFEQGRVYSTWQYNESNYPLLFNHPLHTKYTREFWFPKGKKGDEIKLKTSIKAARINEKTISQSSGKIEVMGETLRIGNQNFPLAAPGSIRLGIEFYQLVTEKMNNEDITYYKDTGVGYHVLAEFRQYTMKGGSRF